MAAQAIFMTLPVMILFGVLRVARWALFLVAWHFINPNDFTLQYWLNGGCALATIEAGYHLVRLWRAGHFSPSEA